MLGATGWQRSARTNAATSSTDRHHVQVGWLISEAGLIRAGHPLALTTVLAAVQLLAVLCGLAAFSRSLRCACGGRSAHCGACWSSLPPWIVRRGGVHGRAAVIDGVAAQLVVPGFVPVDLAQPVRGCRRTGRRRGAFRARPAIPWHRGARCRPRPPTRGETCPLWPPIGPLPPQSHTVRPPHGGVPPGTRGNASRC
jgi:hypothetical protein